MLLSLLQPHNSTSSIFGNVQGHGILRDGTTEPEEMGTGSKKRSIMSDINRHAAVVLEDYKLGWIIFLTFVMSFPCLGYLIYV